MIVGVLGGGQLGRMLALAGYPLGLRFRFLDPHPEAPVGMLAELSPGEYEDAAARAERAEADAIAAREAAEAAADELRLERERGPG